MTERRNPFEGVTDLFSELARVRSTGVHGGPEHALTPAERTHASAWVPATDILARGEDLVIRVELAGVDPEDVELSFSHGVLTVSGARPQDASEDGVEFLVRERFYGAFRRTITLPEGTEPDQIHAEFDDGLVEVTVSNGVSPADSTRIALTDKSSGRTSRTVGRG
ncbi:Hsp20/alpha crystallin family protein [Nocardioides lianchengensis]|uniref:HSP20 family protein n=1 Tax=Nocardioides lianchengensis TaxID=1045774 RepID=A0A1G6PR51_9ACTN|nr:Hsp20/alpha crystallin family protein [Nocardioides lianchengensis]NYG11934.1 HSP20 family protein [Nocardioides lianchengensis]SDC82134.1 HSP20 family protein [Nocardioides lianchengensis]